MLNLLFRNIKKIEYLYGGKIRVREIESRDIDKKMVEIVSSKNYLSLDFVIRSGKGEKSKGIKEVELVGF